LLDRVAECEQRVKVGSEQLTRAVAETYAKLLAFKDEYEVARLYTDGRWQAKLAEVFEGDYEVSYLLAPPLLSRNNVKRRFGPWMVVGFRLLARLKPLRGTWLDPFAYTRDRRQDQWLITHFEKLIDALLDELDAQNLNVATRIAGLGLDTRGYGHVKAKAIERMLEKERALMEEFRRPPAPVTMFDPKAGRYAA
jgi:indolepyruvate ferredoxin oxidoreductase